MVKCCDMNSGMLREPVTFERSAKTPDGAGGFTEVWGAIAGSSARAHVKAMSGSERWASDRTEARSSWRIVVRYFSDLWESDRVVIRGRAYDINFINNVELRDRWLEIDLRLGEAT